MKSENSKTSDEKDLGKIQFWNRVQLLLVLAVFTAPIAGAIFYKPSSFNNYGDIYSPVRQVSNLVMTKVLTDTSETVEFDSLRRQWVFLVTANSDCAEACEANILKMRQLRFMQNNNMQRIRTVFMQTGLPSEIAVDLSAKYSPVEVYSVSNNDYQQWIEILKIEGAPLEAQKDRIYIIDPAGNLMMSYPASADPNVIKKDIKRLLKTSQIG